MKDNSHLYGDAKATARRAQAASRGSALADAQTAYDADSTTPDAIRKLADELNKANRKEDAEKMYREYVAVAPADQEAYFELALLNKSLGRIDGALEFFTKVVEMAPGSPLARSAEYEMWALDGKGGQGWVKK